MSLGEKKSIRTTNGQELPSQSNLSRSAPWGHFTQRRYNLHGIWLVCFAGKFLAVFKRLYFPWWWRKKCKVLSFISSHLETSERPEIFDVPLLSGFVPASHVDNLYTSRPTFCWALLVARLWVTSKSICSRWSTVLGTEDQLPRNPNEFVEKMTNFGCQF